MLEGLDKIEWHTLHHAYGPADDVPETLRALDSGVMSAQEAFELLGVNIYHQGTVYEATAPTVPFLIELLQSNFVKDKEWLLLLLACLAQGRSYLAVHSPLLEAIKPGLVESVSGHSPGSVGFEQEVKKELNWAMNVHAAVADGITQYLPLLDHERHEVRTATARLLACCPGSGLQVVPVLRRHLAEEMNDETFASLALSLRTHTGLDGNAVECLAASLRSSSLLRRTVAALVLAGPEMAEEVIECLKLAIQESDALRGAYVFEYWEMNGVDTAVCAAFYFLGEKKATEILLALLGESEGVSTYAIAEFLMGYYFPRRSRREQIAPQSISSDQRRILSALCRTKSIWQARADRTLQWHYGAYYGIPGKQNELMDFLAESEAG